MAVSNRFARLNRIEIMLSLIDQHYRQRPPSALSSILVHSVLKQNCLMGAYRKWSIATVWKSDARSPRRVSATRWFIVGIDCAGSFCLLSRVWGAAVAQHPSSVLLNISSAVSGTWSDRALNDVAWSFIYPCREQKTARSKAGAHNVTFVSSKCPCTNIKLSPLCQWRTKTGCKEEAMGNRIR